VRCPFCAGSDSRVVDTRTSEAGAVVRRRRECEACGKRWSTFERVEDVLPTVVKKDGRREPFDRKKILEGLTRACQKRPVGTEAIDAAVDAVERAAVGADQREVTSGELGERMMEELRKLDPVAYVRFASVYRSFDDVGAFRRELESLDGETAGGETTEPLREGSPAS